MTGLRRLRWVAVLSLNSHRAARDEMTWWIERRQLSSVASRLFPVAGLGYREMPVVQGAFERSEDAKRVCSYGVFKCCGSLGCHQTAAGTSLLNP